MKEGDSRKAKQQSVPVNKVLKFSLYYDLSYPTTMSLKKKKNPCQGDFAYIHQFT